MAKVMGQAILVVNGLPVMHVKSLRRKTQIKREVVQGMRPDGRPFGMVDGPESYEIELDLYIPAGGENINFKAITDGVIYVTGRDGVGTTALATGVFVTGVDVDTPESGATTRKITAAALYMEEL